VAAINGWLKTGLAPCRGLPGVVDVRTLGAIGVVQMDRINDLRALKRLLLAEGVWIRPFRDILYLTPAFTATEEDVMRLTGAITRVLERGHP
jgi:adenosylmethionine-8-amino-7-oxononanoate aminotransferase